MPVFPPLRTGRDTFASSGSSLSNASGQTQLHNFQVLAMDFVAFTIRAWSRHTLRERECQSMAYHSVSTWEAAPAVVASAVICFASSIRFAKLSREGRPPGSLPAFAWGDVVDDRNPYPPHYKAAFAFSVFRYPQSRRLALRLAHLSERVRFSLSADSRCVRDRN